MRGRFPGDATKPWIERQRDDCNNMMTKRRDPSERLLKLQTYISLRDNLVVAGTQVVLLETHTDDPIDSQRSIGFGESPRTL